MSWQIVPTVLGDMMKDTDRGRARRVMEAMLQMKKLDIAGLERAYAGRHRGRTKGDDVMSTQAKSEPV